MRKAYTQLHLAVLLAGLTGILGRLITLNELMIVCYRMLLTVLSMWVLFAWRKKIESLSSLTIAKIMAVGMIAIYGLDIGASGYVGRPGVRLLEICDVALALALPDMGRKCRLAQLARRQGHRLAQQVGLGERAQ